MSKTRQYKTAEFNVSHVRIDNPIDHPFPLHIHDHFEILCIVSGNAKYMVEGKIYDLHPGALMIMRSAETHKIIMNTNEPYERYVLNFYPEKLTAMGFSETLFLPFTNRGLGEKNIYLASEFDTISPEKHFLKMFAEAERGDPSIAVLANLASLLSAICLAFEQKEQNAEKKQRDLSAEIIHYINENLFSDLSLTGISETLHISPSQINRIFRRLTGTSVYHYILSKRLTVAQERITKGESATATSQSCGFRDYSSFYRLYKKHFGTAPTAAKKHS